jgi:hypothetical protein
MGHCESIIVKTEAEIIERVKELLWESSNCSINSIDKLIYDRSARELKFNWLGMRADT